MIIESGVTSDRRNRILIYVVLCSLFAGWFGYDGFVGYPAKNMGWARQNLATVPDFPQPEQIKPNPKATFENLKQVQPGMAMSEVRNRLGEPTYQKGKDCYYIGQASYGWFIDDGNKIVEVRKVDMNGECTDSNIANQKRLAALVGVGAIVGLVCLARVLMRRTVLDDRGLRIGGKQIDWDAMRSLDAGEYARKAWLDLVYDVGGGTAQVRLDSYDIAFFDEIVTEICRRKGFTSPLPPAETDTPE